MSKTTQTTVTPAVDPLAQAAKEQRIRELEALLKAEQDRNAALLARKQTINVAVSSKGGVSVYGLGRFPVTLYGRQWERLAEALPGIMAFVKEAQKLGALAPEDKDAAFIQPNGIPLKFKAKVAQEAKPKTGSAL